LAAARQFHSAAQYALEHQYMPVFVDTLFSANELAVKALMLGFRPDLRKSKKHTAVHSAFNQFAGLGNVEKAQKDTYNKLAQMRPITRYLHSDVALSEEEATHVLTTVGDMITQLETSLA
jgi:uncharacterized protein (UPF0332 family)